MLWYYFHKIWWHFDQIYQNWWKFSGLLISWKFWVSVKFADKSWVNNVTKFGETKCFDIIFTKLGEILIKFTKHGENSNVYKKISSCFFHQILWFFGGAQFVISLVIIFLPNMVIAGVIHFIVDKNFVTIFRWKICEFVGENMFTKCGENERDSLKLLTKKSLNFVIFGGNHQIWWQICHLRPKGSYCIMQWWQWWEWWWVKKCYQGEINDGTTRRRVRIQFAVSAPATSHRRLMLLTSWKRSSSHLHTSFYLVFQISFTLIIVTEWKIAIINIGRLGKTLCNTSAVQMEFCQIAFQPPRPQANGRFVGTIFVENR